MRRPWARRRFLRLTTSALGVPGLLLGLQRRGQAASPDFPPALEQRLADFALAMRYDDLPADVVAATKRIVLDTLACALNAVGSDAATIARDTIGSTFGDGRAATIIGAKRHATIEGAAFVNGVLVRSLDLNDTYLGTEPLHPSELFPTAMAICEDGRQSGRELIVALIAGYESSMRINDAVSFMQGGFHPLCAAAYGAPLIAGRLWKLQPSALANAVGLSAARGYTSFVVNSGAISMMKAMGFAAGAVDAIFATRLARNGFTGPRDTLEWFAARGRPMRSGVLVDLEPSRFRMRKVAFKRFPIQIELAAIAEAGCALSPRVRGRSEAIQAVRVSTYPGIISRVADAPKFQPQTRGTADHSLPVCLAMALLDGDVTLEQFEKDRWRQADVMALVARTIVAESPELIAKIPKGRGAKVEIEFADGERLEETVEIPEGDAQRPLSQASLERKFLTASTPVIGNATARKVLAQVADLENIPDVSVLARSLAGNG